MSLRKHPYRNATASNTTYGAFEAFNRDDSSTRGQCHVSAISRRARSAYGAEFYQKDFFRSNDYVTKIVYNAKA